MRVACTVEEASASELRSLCNSTGNKDTTFQTKEGYYTVYLLYGSWNTNLIHPNVSISIENEEETMKAHGNLLSSWLSGCWTVDPFFEHIFKSIELNVHTVKVNQDEDTLGFCIGDGQQTNELKSSILQAPSDLPALFLVDQNLEKVEYHLMKIDPYQLTDCFVHCNNSPFLPLLKRVILDSYLLALQALLSKAGKFQEMQCSMKCASKRIKSMNLSSRGDESNQAIRIFITGDKSQVGKSSICLGLIGTLLTKLNYSPSSLAYIKPATQCEESQLIAKYCEKHAIDNEPIGPIVYYKGFTRAFLDGETDDTETLLQNAKAAVDKLAKNKKVIIIDGVGYPAVGSICGTDNVSVAKASSYEFSKPSGEKQIVPPAVLIVGKRGVGDAIDSYNLNSTYFKARNVQVLGAIFNRLPNDPNHYYSLKNCEKAVSSYFAKSNQHESVFGFIPEIEGLSSKSMESADEFIDIFAKHVDVQKILEHAKKSRDKQVNSSVSVKRSNNGDSHAHAQKKLKAIPQSSVHNDSTMKVDGSKRIRLTRDQIEITAKSQGAAGG